MWWEAQSDSERQVREIVFRLNDYFLTESMHVSAVYAVGSVIRHGVRCPLLVVDRAYAPAFAPRSLQRQLLSLVGLRRLHGDELADRLLVPWSKAPEEVHRMLARWDVPQNTQLLFSSPPLSQASPGSLVWTNSEGDGDRATAGFEIRIDQRVVLTTAGHLVKNAPCAVFERSEHWFSGPHYEPIGSIKTFNDPRTTAGVDIAVIDLLQERSGGGAASIAGPNQLAEFDVLRFRGGRSGKRFGWIMGALNSTRSLDGRIWANSWNVVGSTNAFAQRGDSGGPALCKDYVVGHLVAALGAYGEGEIRQCGVIQDAETIRDYLAKTYNSSVTILDRGLDF